MADGIPDEDALGGFKGEVQRHYATTSEVQAMLRPLSEKIDTHLGYHKGLRFTFALVVPLICVLITATAIIIAAFVP